jgi:hypothetical protein
MFFWLFVKLTNTTNINKETFILPKIYGLELKKKHILKLSVFVPNLAQFSQSILIIQIDRKLA